MTADLADELSWAGEEALPDLDLGGAMRSALREEYAWASDEEMQDALDNVLDAMSPAEGFNFGAALSQIGRSASRLASDPTFVQIARTAAPIAGGALGTMVGGPIGTALGTQLGNMAVSALPAPAPPRVAPAPAPPRAPVAAPVPAPAAPPAPPAPTAPAAPPAPAAPAPAAPAAPALAAPGPVPGSPVAGGSAAAAQGLVLTQQPDVLRSLLATALGQHGRREVSGVPAAQVLAMLSQVFGQAAADADELMYLEQQPEAGESFAADAPGGPSQLRYTDLLGADNLELAEATGWGGDAEWDGSS
jgi:hypothetical protein